MPKYTNTMTVDSSFVTTTATPITASDGLTVALGKAQGQINKGAPNLLNGVLGNIPYQSAADTTLYVAPNTTTTRQFLSETGNGSIGAAPTLGILLPSDIPAQGYTSQAAGVITLTSASDPIQALTGAAASTITLPDATTLKLNYAYTIINTSTGGNAQILNNAATSLGYIPAFNQAIITCTSIATAAGTWVIKIMPINSINQAATGLNNTALGTSTLTAVTSGANNVALGSLAGSTLTTTSNSTLVGYNAGNLTTAASNQLIGYNAGSSITSGGNNTYLGAYSGSSGSDSTRSNNVILSDGAGNVTLRSNGLAANTLPVAIGLGAAALTTTGASTTAVGINALSALTTNGLSTAVGYQAGKLATGAGNQLFGYNAGSALSQSIATLGAITGGTLYTNGTYNNVNMSLVSGTAMTNYPKVNITVTGGAVTVCTLATYGMGGDTTTVLTVTSAQIGNTGSGFSVPVATVTACANNTIVGAYTGGSFNKPSNNVVLSDGAGNIVFNTGSSTNLAIGTSALYSNTTGSNNTASGNLALYSNTTGTGNTASGNQALFSNTTGLNNTASGNFALYSNTTGLNNIASGYQALYSNTTGTGNTASGYQALYSNTTGLNNTASGYQALSALTTNGLSTAVGYQAGKLVTGAGNQLIGYNAGSAVTAGASNTYLGAYTGSSGSDSTSSNNVILSDGAGNVTLRTNGASESSNISMGLNALPNSSANMVNIAIGGGALASATTQSVAIGNIGIGYRTLYNNSTGLSNIAIGNSALALNTGGGNAGDGNYTGSLAIGTYALSASTTGLNIALGNSALKTCTTGTGNVAFGYSALCASTTANANVAVGFSSGVSTSTGASNTYIGSSTGFANTTGSSNTYVGVNSGYTYNGGSGAAMGPSTGSNNTYVGATSGGASLGAASNNTYIGSSAGLCTSEGSNNNYIGTSAAASMALTATIGGFAGGSGYVDGTYTNVPLQYFNAYFMLLYPVCNITVLGGTVTAVTIVKQGLFSTNSYTVQNVATAPNSYLGGSGSGFTVSLGAISGFGTASSSSFNTFLGGYNGAANVTDASTGNNVILSDGSGNIVFRANGIAGQNTLIGVNSGVNIFTVSTFGWLNGGTGYAAGGTATYNNVTMSTSSGQPMTVYPVVNVTVTAGVITAVTLVSGGSGAGRLQNSFLTVTAAQLGGTGSGFSIAILSTATPTNCTYLGGYTGSADAATNNNVILSDGAGNVTLKANGITQAYNANTAWTPTDGSGAALSLTIVSATYSSMSNQVTFTSTITYPTTANGSNAIISSTARAANQQTLVQAFSIGLGIALVGVISAGGTSIALYNATTGVAVTNTTLSGATVIISGTYST